MHLFFCDKFVVGQYQTAKISQSSEPARVIEHSFHSLFALFNMYRFLILYLRYKCKLLHGLEIYMFHCYILSMLYYHIPIHLKFKQLYLWCQTFYEILQVTFNRELTLDSLLIILYTKNCVYLRNFYYSLWWL